MATRGTITIILQTQHQHYTSDTLQKFRQLLEQHWQTDVIYTDVSKMETGIGCAMYIFSTWESHPWTLPSVSSVNTAELYAIRQSLLHFDHFQPNGFAISSDSMISLQAIKNIYGEEDPLINKIQDHYTQPKTNTRKDVLCGFQDTPV